MNKQNKKAYNQEVRKRNRLIVYKHYCNNPCIDCGESDVAVLELDHLKDKTAAITKAVRNRWSQKKLLDEISKCVVRCANCHRRKTAREQDWYKDLQGLQEDP